MLETKDIITIVVSFSALLVSLFTLYLSQLSAAYVQIMAGEHTNLGHYREGNFNITLPVTFVNHGARTAIVRRVALLVQTPGNNEGYILEPFFYQKINELGAFQQESQPAPVAIGGRQNLTRQILFRSSVEHPTDFQLLNSGTYNFTLLGWVKNPINPDISDRFSLVISPDIASTLQTYFADKNGSTVRVPQAAWRNWIAQPLTEYQVKGLFK